MMNPSATSIHTSHLSSAAAQIAAPITAQLGAAPPLRLVHPRLSFAATANSTQASRAPLRVHRLRPDSQAWLPTLAELLIDNVHRGASLGFLAPLSRSAALSHWQDVLANLGPHRSLWVASESDIPGAMVHGAVQLSLCPQANGHHRGEVQGMMVHSNSRGRGLASQLMTRVECAAMAKGRSLLVLDTPSGSQAEAVYAHLGWQRAGEIPDYDACAEGRLHSTARYFKRLQAPMG